MPVDPTINQNIDNLVADLRTKEQGFSDASDANDSAQAAVATGQRDRAGEGDRARRA